MGLEPKTYRYASKRSGDGEVRARRRDLAAERRRFGSWRLHILLSREGIQLNQKRLFRICHEERLGVRKRGDRRRALGTRSPMTLPDAANYCWSLDFISDALGNGRRFRVLAVVDDFTRECLSLVADTSLSGIVSDNGTELTSHAICVGGRSDRCCGIILCWVSRSRTGSWKL